MSNPSESYKQDVVPAKRRAPLDSDEMPATGRVGESFELPDRVTHYLTDVLRMQAGECVDLFDGSGRVILAEILGGDSERLQVCIRDDRMRLQSESPCAITLVQAMPKGKRFDLILEKATELGVARIIPLESRRTVVKIPEAKIDKKLTRWERIIEGGARQCRRNITPELGPAMNLGQAIESLQGIPNFVAHTAPGLASLPEILGADAARSSSADFASHPSVALWIGPEGGFDEAEIATLLDKGAHAFHLGPRVLRAETASLVGLSLIQAYLGDLA
ncbi:16S rRNA (uracil(1498)-N(3))-methyltransferase [Bradymonas sediminis]|nr:16S rRNA (uracil(1498)-N(3))-methyltransferase [Bradymonas sediminis]TDP73409.1 16S rRNA (uracil1498-N3)-methyltransferase [Bradymonas sediminis]